MRPRCSTARARCSAVREDVGRHNAVDKIVGHALLADTLPLSEHILFVSGRGGFEIVQKALVAGVPVVGSVSAPSSLAVRLARETDLTLIGFLRERRFVVHRASAGSKRSPVVSGFSRTFRWCPALAGPTSSRASFAAP